MQSFISGNHHHALEKALTWLQAGSRVALAIIIACKGSSPRPIGSQLVVRDDGCFAGSVTGGCIEADLVLRARSVLHTGKPVCVSYKADQQFAWEVGLACGGEIELFIMELTMDHPYLAFARNPGQATTIMTRLADGAIIASDSIADSIADTFQIKQTQGRIISLPDHGRVFVHPFLPALEIVVIGAVDIARQLAAMVPVLNYTLRIIEPRPAWADALGESGIASDQRWPDEALAEEPLTAQSALAALSHDPRLDDLALVAAFASPAFYIGALGSRKTHRTRCERLEAQGAEPAQLARIKAPIGLDIGAQTPAEIALSIISEITLAHRGAKRDTKRSTRSGSWL
ncbi:MAG: XdhC family protein [Pseudomonadota bacterium]